MGESDEAGGAFDGVKGAISEGSFLHKGTVSADVGGWAALGEDLNHTLLGHLPQLPLTLRLKTHHNLHAQWLARTRQGGSTADCQELEGFAAGQGRLKHTVDVPKREKNKFKAIGLWEFIVGEDQWCFADSFDPGKNLTSTAKLQIWQEAHLSRFVWNWKKVLPLNRQNILKSQS